MFPRITLPLVCRRELLRADKQVWQRRSTVILSVLAKDPGTKVTLISDRDPSRGTAQDDTLLEKIMQIVEVIFWLSTTSVAYAYAIYPAVIYACSRLFGRAPSAPEVNDADLPTISLLIAAHNED